MAQEIINIGTLPNDGEGDPLRVAFGKINNNFSNLFATATNTLESITIGTSANQVIWQTPVSEFTQGKFQIRSGNPNNNDSQNITISAQILNNLTQDIEYTKGDFKSYEDAIDSILNTTNEYRLVALNGNKKHDLEAIYSHGSKILASNGIQLEGKKIYSNHGGLYQAIKDTPGGYVFFKIDYRDWIKNGYYEMGIGRYKEEVGIENTVGLGKSNDFYTEIKSVTVGGGKITQATWGKKPAAAGIERAVLLAKYIKKYPLEFQNFKYGYNGKAVNGW